MTRALPEWIGRTADSVIPARVRLRIFEAQGGCCDECGRKMGVAGERWEVDHAKALILGGENRETNLRALCRNCHAGKTREDVAQKSTEARKRKKHLGLDRPKRKMSYRRFNGEPVWRD
jgi:5-methylcytosine-specific restriction enzyme A